MLTHYLTIGWRTLRRNPLNTLINVFGLSIGVAACVLIFLFVQDELTFDRFHANGDRIYRVVRHPKPNMDHFALNKTITPYAPIPLAPAMEAEIPGVDRAVRLMLYGEATFTVDNRHFGQNIVYADSNFFSVFSFPLLAGDSAHALSDPSSIVIHKDLAIKWFGTADVVGRSLDVSLWGRTTRRQISGVLGDYPGSSTINASVIARTNTTDSAWNSWNCVTYALLDPTADKHATEQEVNRLFQSRFSAARNGANPFLIALQPLRDVHLDPETGGNQSLYSYILSCIAVIVLLIACINFVTLAMARSTTRAKEVSMRKVFGAVRLQLARQFWSESLIIAFAAVVAGIAFSELALPMFNNLSNKTLSLDFLANPALWAIIGALLLLLTVAAGSVPALILSRMQPTTIMRRESGLKKGGPLTKSLVVLQYALSITLLICMAGMFAQSRYVHSKSLGFDAEQVVVVTNHAPQTTRGADILDRLRIELAGDSRISHVAGASSSVNRGWNIMEWPFRGNNLKTYVMDVDHEYLPTLGINLVAGRNFSRDIPSDQYHSVVVNESFVRAAGLADPIGTPVTGLNTGPNVADPVIIGVIEDIHLRSLHEPIEPLTLIADPESATQLFLIRIDGRDLHGAIQRIEQAWNQVTAGSRFDYSFLDEDVAAQYEADQRWMRIISYSSVTALIVATLGLFGLAGVSAVRRMKEISIRKVLGATMPQVLRTLNTEFLWLIAVSNAIAWPAAYFILDRWLQNFAYRTELSLWSFVLAAGLAIVVAGAAISFHTIRAASINPASMLRQE